MTEAPELTPEARRAIPSLAEALTEIRRLRTDVEALDAMVMHERGISDGLRERVAVLEAAYALLRGTLAEPTPNEPATITHDVPPNAPR